MDLLVKHNTAARAQFPESKRLARRFQEKVATAIDFSLPDQDGTSWRLADHIATGPVLLVFYRGDW